MFQSIRRCIAVAVSLMISSHSLADINPMEITPFKLPKGMQTIDDNYRRDLVRITGFEYSGLHWGQFVLVYTSKAAHPIYRHNYLEYLRQFEDEDEDEEEESGAESDASNYQQYPIGTVFLKENYAPANGHPGHALTLTLMIKREAGYDPGKGDWEYIQSDIQGNIIMQGNSQNAQIYQVCAKCHNNMAERDYIFATYYSRPGS